MISSMKDSNIRKLVLAALFAGLCTIMTLVIQIPSPMQGYVNLGDCAVLMAAWTLGPVSGGMAAAQGHEIVPTDRARALVTYLLSLNNVYAYPEARPAAPETTAAPAAAPGPVTPIPAAAPDEKKKK